MNPTESKIFKVDKFVNKLDLKAFLDDNSRLPCEITGSSFLDKNKNLVIMDKLEIINNSKLHKPFSKCPM